MKEISKILAISIVFVFMATSFAMADIIYYPDVTKDWPGYETSVGDALGTPKISGMTLTIEGDYLQSIAIDMTGRQVYDSLYINAGMQAGESYEAWDWYAKDTTLADDGAIFYSVAATYTYAYDDIHRPGHPVAITDGITEKSGLLQSVIWSITNPADSGPVDDVGVLTYLFAGDGIFLGDKYVIGYTPWCANDVILTPEPLTILLLGFGLLGLGLARRKS
jgi:hypothetical protein